MTTGGWYDGAVYRPWTGGAFLDSRTGTKTPASSRGRASDAGIFPAGGDSYHRPSGRHELLAVLPRIISDLSFGRAVDIAERITINVFVRAAKGEGPSHAALCLDMPGEIHACGFETRMRGGVLVRPTGEEVRL